MAGFRTTIMTESEVKTDDVVLCTRLVGLPGSSRLFVGILGLCILALNVWHFYGIAQVLRTDHPLMIDPRQGRLITAVNAVCAVIGALAFCFRYVFILKRDTGVIVVRTEFTFGSTTRGLRVRQREVPLAAFSTVEVDRRSVRRGLTVTLRGEAQSLLVGTFATDGNAAEKLGREVSAATNLPMTLNA